MKMQSNLWLLTGELCDLMAEYNVSLGTSLDGPDAVTDAQRGRGYWRRTMDGIGLARKAGLNPGCICTFTRQSVPYAGEILDFFIREKLNFTIHAAVPPLAFSGLDASSSKFGRDSALSRKNTGPGTGETCGHRFFAGPEQDREKRDHDHRAAASKSGGFEGGGAEVTMDAERWALEPESFGSLLVAMLDDYLAKRAGQSQVRIGTLDLLCRSVSSGEGGICTHRDCLGSYLAVAPDGGIYPCQRFAGLESFKLGNVHGRPSVEQLEQAPAWQMLRERERRIREECGGCSFFNICMGGCPYNALAARQKAGRSAWKDPYCSSYRQIFGYITERALAEVFTKENMDAVVEQPGGSLLRKGMLLEIMNPVPGAGPARSIIAKTGLDSPAVGDTK
jgi:radical SAM protein with 4Fe4S-binding SPASM domain